MGFLSRLLKRPEPPSTDVESRADSGEVRRPGVVPDLVQLSGTMTVAKATMAAYVARADPEDTGYIEAEGVVQREPDNPVDPDAVTVLLEGERVGYLPGYVGKVLDLSESGARTVRVQVFTQLLEKGLRVEAWAWLGAGSPVWQWSEQRRPPMSTGAKRTAEHRQRDQMVKDALAGGGERAAQFEAGMAGGVHYLQTVEPIKQLKREGRYDEALALCYVAIEGAETAAQRDRVSPPPFYTEQAAIILRKLGRRDEEIAILRRFLRACPPRYRDNSMKTRLDKLLGD